MARVDSGYGHVSPLIVSFLADFLDGEVYSSLAVGLLGSFISKLLHFHNSEIFSTWCPKILDLYSKGPEHNALVWLLKSNCNRLVVVGIEAENLNNRPQPPAFYHILSIFLFMLISILYS